MVLCVAKAIWEPLVKIDSSLKKKDNQFFFHLVTTSSGEQSL